jgi:hypothetical protein
MRIVTARADLHGKTTVGAAIRSLPQDPWREEEEEVMLVWRRGCRWLLIGVDFMVMWLEQSHTIEMVGGRRFLLTFWFGVKL